MEEEYNIPAENSGNPEQSAQAETGESDLSGVSPGTKTDHSNLSEVAPYVMPEKHHQQTGGIALLKSPEGKVLLAGAALAIVYVAYLALLYIFQPTKAQILTGLTAIELMIGRAAAMAFGYSMMLKHFDVIPPVIIVETIFVLTFYPLFVFSCRQLRLLKPLQKYFDRVHTEAVKRKPFVQKYGLIGLFAFVFFPLWMTGPAVGAVIGYLLEMPMHRCLLAVLAGTYTAVVCWAMLMFYLGEKVAEYGSYATMIMFLGVVGMIVLGNYLSRSKAKNNSEGRRQNTEH